MLLSRTARSGATRRSLYLTMRDGARVAIDVTLPAGASPHRQVPAILHQTRYFRAVDWRALPRAAGVAAALDLNAPTRAAFVAAGYAWIDVDTRGSGASSGWRACPWSPDEVADGAEIATWIAAQPWSTGAIGATGISYGGTAAEMLLVNRHPAVRAVAPRFSAFDVYADVAFPGGLHLAWFTDVWSRFNRALDANAYDQALALMLRINAAALRELPPRPDAARHLGRRLGRRLAVRLADTDAGQRLLAALARRAARGVAPVDRDRGAIAAAAREHARNTDVHAGALRMRHRDDTGVLDAYPDRTIDAFSPHAHLADIAAAGAAVYGYSGWLDGAYQLAAIKRHLNLPRGSHRLILGPWDHGGRQNVSPFDASWQSRFDHAAELLRFFDPHLRGRDAGIADAPPVRYFTMGQERWKTADTWPPPGVRAVPWRLRAGHALSPAASGAPGDSDAGSVDSAGEPGVDSYRVDPDAGTGQRSRWRSLIGLAAPLGYGDRAAADRRLLCYTSPPLPADLEVTGHPIARLFVSADAPDGALFAYLEDVAPDGRVTYVTEGVLRLAFWPLPDAPPYASPVPQRRFWRADARPLAPGQIVEVALDLLPVSYLYRRGHAVRLAIAGADRDHFAPVDGGAATLRVHRGPHHPSRLELPIAG